MVRAPIDLAIRATTGRAAGAGAAALARGDEDHVGAREGLLDLLRVVLGGAPSDLGVGAGAEAARQLPPDVELDVGVAHQQRLGVGVDGDELDAAQAELDHPVHRVDAAAADTDDLDHREVVLVRCHVRPPWEIEKPQPLLEVQSLSQYSCVRLTVSAAPSSRNADAPRVAKRSRAQSARKTALPGADTS